MGVDARGTGGKPMILLHTSRAFRSLSADKQLGTRLSGVYRLGRTAEPRLPRSYSAASASPPAVSADQSEQLATAEVRLSDLQGRIGPLSTVRSVCLFSYPSAEFC